MLELGEHEAEAHLEAGAIAGRNADKLYLLGERMVKYAAEGALLADMQATSIIRCSSHIEIANRIVAIRRGQTT